MLKKLQIILFSLGLLLLAAPAEAATTLHFYPLSVQVVKGQVFKLKVSINPSGKKNYTVKASVVFPPDLVQISSWDFDKTWIPVKKSGLDYLSNSEGKIIRTAGYPGGFNGVTAFATATFVAQKSGTGLIEFTDDSAALDEKGVNQYLGGSNALLMVDDAGVVSTEASSSTSPLGLTGTPISPASPSLEVKFVLTKASVQDVSQMQPQISFQGVDGQPVPVEVTFVVKNAAGSEVYREKEGLVVNKQKMLIKQFPSTLKLPPGSYTLLVNTLYNGVVAESFSKQFKIVKPSQPAKFPWTTLALCLVEIILIKVWALMGKRRRAHS